MEGVSDDALAWAAERLGHRFARPALLREALTHASAGQPDYQRLEFVGDRVLALAVATQLHAEEADLATMARRLAALVDRTRCTAVARTLDCATHVRVDRGARTARVHQSDAVLADVCEALIGAIYLDAGWDAAQACVHRIWAGQGDKEADSAGHPKNRLQEWALARGFKLPAYEVVAREGPDHAPRFRVQLSVTGQEAVASIGASKQEAETAAAVAMLLRLGI